MTIPKIVTRTIAQKDRIDPNSTASAVLPQTRTAISACARLSPARCRAAGDAPQAPHINVSIFARGLLKRLVTRIYFPGEPLNETDPLLSALPVARRATLIARAADGGAAERVLHFDIVLQGENETVFLDRIGRCVCSLRGHRP